MKRVFLIVLDSFGIGAMPDSEKFGDVGVNTLRSCASTGKLHIPNMIAAGLGNVDGVDCLPKTDAPTGAYARLTEASMGKDTTIGHWEIAGIVSPDPLPTYPQGFPKEVLEEFERLTGRGCLCNLPYSGTDVIRDYGEESMKTGKVIVYTSADSVFQIAANEAVVPIDELYDICAKARELLKGDVGVGRVIARPFEGDCAANFQRTPRRHDYSLQPPRATMLDAISAAGRQVIAVGKIHDIFAGQGVTETIRTSGNTDGLRVTRQLLDRDFTGLAFVNLVDFDMLYGHRRDVPGYAAATAEFDSFLPEFMAGMQPEDVLMITADHGCDPSYLKTTDHTREYVPYLIYGQGVQPGVDLGTRLGFGAIANTVCDALGICAQLDGKSVWNEVKR